MRNPCSKKKPLTRADYSVDEYVTRIQKLISRHTIRMVDGRMNWLVTVPGKGKIEMVRVKYEEF